jgi:AcrR family transcriptional regulator
MPKRDEAYMEGQRELIERAALECLLDKGVYGTTLRDVCERVGMSMGALYVHYRTRDDLFVAALRMEPMRQLTQVSTWADYVAAPRQFLQRLASTDDRSRRRMRLALQFVAEHALAKENPPGFTELFQISVGYYRECLQAIQRRGEITLPLGLRATSELHHRLEIGTIYMVIADKTLDVRQAASTLLDGFALTAGLTDVPKRRRPVKG